MRHKQDNALCIPEKTFTDRIAWLQWIGAFQEANALRELAPFFEPPYRIDERAIDSEVARLAEASDRTHDPRNWS